MADTPVPAFSTIEPPGNDTQDHRVSLTRSSIGYAPVTADTYYQQISDALQHTQHVLSYVCFAINAIKTAIFGQRSMRNSPSGKFMLSISVSQFCFVIFKAINGTAERVITVPKEMYAYSFFYLYVAISVGNVLYRASLFIACLMSSERLYAVSRPLHVKQFILARHPLLFIAAVFFLTACYHFYVPLQYLYYTKSGVNGSKTVVIGYTDWYFRNRDIVDAFSAAGKIIFLFVPLVWLTFFNALVVCFLRRHSNDRKAIKSTVDEEAISRRDRQMTLTILACTAGYVIFMLPGAIHFLAVAVVPEYNYAEEAEEEKEEEEEEEDIKYLKLKLTLPEFALPLETASKLCE
ncbi:hypothetical protein C0Q70_07451 [Pomacea canaliculata]|uniref:G-protein coupled receptors family 1 profile domain-containing protein n=1 Tax=Pomacea canaliculata TaxID=400727 RepID=A0A2T7PF27_POMCA|nr:hypothetical protein C0Q70_07451 [Pomacea canaliculata]